MPSTAAPARTAHVTSPSADTPKAAARWGKRLGIAAFVYFLIKGLAWLIVPAAVTYFASR